VAERSVELLVSDGRVEVEVLPALSFLDLVWARLGVDPLGAGVRLVDGQRFGAEAAGERGPLLVAQCDARSVLSEIKLSVDDGRPVAAGAAGALPDVVVLQRLGLPDEVVRPVAWDDLDRAFEPDHLTSLWIPALAPAVASEVARFAELVRTLRERCPWDREQTHRSLTRHLLEETYEVLEAIEDLDESAVGDGRQGTGTAVGAGGFAHLEEELGDLLFQVVFHATLATEEGAFTLADVARGVHDKLVGRHPHVFGTTEAATAGDVMRNWEQLKKAEKGRTSMMDGIAGDLPSLLYAHKVQRKAATVGLEPEGTVEERLAAARAGTGHDEIGELLYLVVDLARRQGIDPEAALRGVAGRRRRRFEAAERAAAATGLDLSAMAAADVAALWAGAGEGQPSVPASPPPGSSSSSSEPPQASRH
jgi:tetrapyrrole methylase family protein/MazG family protein